MKAIFKSNLAIAEKNTKKSDANFALVGRFDGGEYCVISMHSRIELANPREVYNERYSDVHVAVRVN